MAMRKSKGPVWGLIVLVVLLTLPASAQQSSLVVPGKSVGLISLEMTLDQIKGILGEGRCTATKVGRANEPDAPEIDATGCTWRDRSGAPTYMLAADTAGRPLFVDRYLDNRLWQTVEGLKMDGNGSHGQADVIRIYGQPERFWSEDWGNAKFFRMRFANGLRIGLLDDPASPFHRRIVSLGIWRPF